MRNVLVAACVAVLVGACGSQSGMSHLEGSTSNLVKETYTVQADEDGLVEFTLPNFDAETEGIPLVQTYESSTEKFQKLYLVHVHHTLDALGTVYLETDPNTWVAIVAVRSERRED